MQSTPPRPPLFPLVGAENDQVGRSRHSGLFLHQNPDGKIGYSFFVCVFKSPAQCPAQRNFSVKLGRTELDIQAFQFLNEIKENIKLLKQYTCRSRSQFKVLLSGVG